jgi:pre-mRNA-processing factor 40
MRLKQAAEEIARRAERKRRHRIDDLRYALKTTKIEVDTSYEDALPLMQDLPEFKDVEEDEDRRAAFDKYIKRMKVGPACM